MLITLFLNQFKTVSENLTPIHIRLIEDKIWIIYGFPQTKNNEIIMGGGLYIEMKKSNGAIIKEIIEE